MLSKEAIRLAKRILRDVVINRPKAATEELLKAGFPVQEGYFQGEGWHASVEDEHRARFSNLLSEVLAKQEGSA